MYIVGMFDLFEVKVFCGEDGSFGDCHGIIIDERRAINPALRLKIAAELKYAETVFINDFYDADVSFFAQTKQIPFAGSAALAAGAFIKELTGSEPKQLVSQNNAIPVKFESNNVWAEAELSILPAWNLKKYDTVEVIEQLDLANSRAVEHTLVWAWINESEGLIRARTFAPDWLLPEVEANGSGSMLLADKLKKEIMVIHGKSSKIEAKPLHNKKAKIGGFAAARRRPNRQIH